MVDKGQGLTGSVRQPIPTCFQRAMSAGLISEVASTHKGILVCGSSAYLACVGAVLLQPSAHELTELADGEVEAVNRRLGAQFEEGWYMGHTRRWSLHRHRAREVLRSVAMLAGWDLVPCAG